MSPSSVALLEGDGGGAVCAAALAADSIAAPQAQENSRPCAAVPAMRAKILDDTIASSLARAGVDVKKDEAMVKSP